MEYNSSFNKADVIKKILLEFNNPVFLSNFGTDRQKNFHLEFIKQSELYPDRLNFGVKRIINRLCSNFLKIYENISKSSLAKHVEKNTKTIIQWYSSIMNDFQCLSSYFNFGECNKSDVDQNTKLQVLHTYGKTVYEVMKNNIPERMPRKDTNLNELLPLDDMRKYDRSLLTIGGGCLADIWKVSKTRLIYKRRTLSTGQLRKSRILYWCSINYRMSQWEKKRIRFSGIKKRDRGGFFIPKWEFIPYLKKLNQKMREVLTLKGIKVHGRNIAQEAAKVVNEDPDLPKLFLATASTLFPKQSKEDQLLFQKEWQPKILHATTNEVLTSWDAKASEKGRNVQKGCASLRDTLFIESAKSGSLPKDKNIGKQSGKCSKTNKKGVKPVDLEVASRGKTKGKKNAKVKTKTEVKRKKSKASEMDGNNGRTTSTNKNEDTLNTELIGTIGNKQTCRHSKKGHYHSHDDDDDDDDDFDEKMGRGKKQNMTKAGEGNNQNCLEKKELQPRSTNKNLTYTRKAANIKKCVLEQVRLTETVLVSNTTPIEIDKHSNKRSDKSVSSAAIEGRQINSSNKRKRTMPKRFDDYQT